MTERKNDSKESKKINTKETEEERNAKEKEKQKR
jgi:hypothetical protein